MLKVVLNHSGQKFSVDGLTPKFDEFKSMITIKNEKINEDEGGHMVLTYIDPYTQIKDVTTQEQYEEMLSYIKKKPMDYAEIGLKIETDSQQKSSREDDSEIEEESADSEQSDINSSDEDLQHNQPEQIQAGIHQSSGSPNINREVGFQNQPNKSSSEERDSQEEEISKNQEEQEEEEENGDKKSSSSDDDQASSNSSNSGEDSEDEDNMVQSDQQKETEEDKEVQQNVSEAQANKKNNSEGNINGEEEDNEKPVSSQQQDSQVDESQVKQPAAPAKPIKQVDAEPSTPLPQQASEEEQIIGDQQVASESGSSSQSSSSQQSPEESNDQSESSTPPPPVDEESQLQTYLEKDKIDFVHVTQGQPNLIQTEQAEQLEKKSQQEVEVLNRQEDKGKSTQKAIEQKNSVEHDTNASQAFVQSFPNSKSVPQGPIRYVKEEQDPSLLGRMVKFEEMYLNLFKELHQLKQKVAVLETERQKPQNSEFVFTICNGCGLFKSKGQRKAVNGAILNIFFCAECDQKYDIVLKQS